MAAPKRSHMQHEEDLALIASLYLRGNTQRAIVQHLAKVRIYTISQQRICDDLKIIRSRWLDSSLRDFDRARAEEFARIDEVERQAWIGWMRSAGTHKVTRTKVRLVNGDGPENEKAVTSERLNGDPRYLLVIQGCIGKRCELLGLDAPRKIELSDLRKPQLMPEKDIDAELTKLLDGDGIGRRKN